MPFYFRIHPIQSSNFLRYLFLDRFKDIYLISKEKKKKEKGK